MVSYSINFAHPVRSSDAGEVSSSGDRLERVRWRIIPSLHEYLSSIHRVPPLTLMEERAIGWKIVNDRCVLSRGLLVRSNLRLVAAIAKQYTGRGAEISELIGEGNTSLTRAAEAFDPALGVRFSTCATWWIKQSMKRVVAACAGPEGTHARRGRLFRPESGLVAFLDSSPSALPHTGAA